MPTDDEELDETVEESFPASDPPANTPETGTRIGEPPPPKVEVPDHPGKANGPKP
jgi:hypothetical protein